MGNHNDVQLSPEAIATANWYHRYKTPPTELQVTRALVEATHVLASEPTNVTYRDVDANGVPGIWVEPIGSNTDYVILHIHNGGTVVASAPMERKTAGHIATAVGVPSLVVDFRLAPEHKYPAQLDDVEAAYNWLLSQGYAADKIIALGHSVGGFLNVALAIRLRDGNKPLPAAIVSISPWCDLEISNETMVTFADRDTSLTKGYLEIFREAWIGGTGVKADDVRINLNKADLRGLPPTLVSWGTYEIMSGEAEIFAQRLIDHGVDTLVMPAPGLQHSYVHGAGKVPEVNHAIQKIASWIHQKTTIPTK